MATSDFRPLEAAAGARAVGSPPIDGGKTPRPAPFRYNAGPTAGARPASLLDATPLAGLTPEEVVEGLRAFGMHPSGSRRPGFRGSVGMLTLRPDTTVDGALEALFSTFRQLDGLLTALEADTNLQRGLLTALRVDTGIEHDVHGKIEAAHVALQLGAGQFFVIDRAIRAADPPAAAPPPAAAAAPCPDGWRKAAQDVAFDAACDLNAATTLLSDALGPDAFVNAKLDGARALVEHAGAKIALLGGSACSLLERPIDWILTPGGRAAATVLASAEETRS